MATKTYTTEERLAALANLPKPIGDFARSDAVTEIYMGLAKKHKLNLREISVISEVANLALLGLEQESALETNIHQVMPEISNALGRELVADINDRIFKEARRRLRENVTSTDAKWDATELGAKPKVGGAGAEIVGDDELDKLVEEEEKAGGFKGLDDSEEDEAVTVTTPPTATQTPSQTPSSASAAVAPASGLSVAEKKLAGSNTMKPKPAVVETKTAPEPSSGGLPPKPAAAPAPAEKSSVKIDPYREQI